MTGNQPTTTVSDDKRHIRYLVSGLILLFVISIISRLYLLPDSSVSGDDQLWQLSITVQAEANRSAPLQMSISPPIDTRHVRVIERSIYHPDFKLRNQKKDNRRDISLVSNTTNPGEITATFLIQLSKSAFAVSRTAGSLTTEQRQQLLTDTNYFEIQSYNVQKKIRELSQAQPDRQLLTEVIFTDIRKIHNSNRTSLLDVAKTLTLKKASTLDRSLAMTALCRAAGIPARLVTGIILEKTGPVKLHHWVQTYENQQWNSYDVLFGYRKTVPENFVPMVFNQHDIVNVTTGHLLIDDMKLEAVYQHAKLQANQSKEIRSVFNLGRLPFDIRQELSLLLLLPVGALITTLFRHMIGVTSYGVFTPTLLSLAIVYADLVTTSLIFIVVCSLAIAGRSFFPKVISRTVRLSIIFTLIAFIMTLSISALSYITESQSDSLILLPIIILTSLVDRFYQAMDERGIKIAINRLMWTMVITLCCLPVIQFETLGQLFIHYPEAHFLTLAVFLLISTYKGKTLLNLPLIRLLAEPPVEPKKNSTTRSKK